LIQILISQLFKRTVIKQELKAEEKDLNENQREIASKQPK